MYQIFLCTEVVKIWIIPETYVMESCPDLLSILKLPRTYKLEKEYQKLVQQFFFSSNLSFEILRCFSIKAIQRLQLLHQISYRMHLNGRKNVHIY
jgi:hypothetical protein